MTTPRIGDTVHYTDTSGHGDCFAAIVTMIMDARYHALRDIAIGATGHIHLVYFGGLTPSALAMNIPWDPRELTDGDGAPYIPMTERTPGTWHHIH